MQRSSAPTSALYVRLPVAEADKLDRAALALGLRKKDLVTDLVATMVDPDTARGLRVLTDISRRPVAADAGADKIAIGSYAFHPHELPEVLTSEQTAQFLQLAEDDVIRLAEAGDLPGRKLSGAWRFSRTGLVSWLSIGVSR